MLLKILPHFLYTRFIRYLILKEKLELDFNDELYEYKFLNHVNGEWVKNSRRFRNIEYQ
jgi:hypothetical protein